MSLGDQTKRPRFRCVPISPSSLGTVIGRVDRNRVHTGALDTTTRHDGELGLSSLGGLFGVSTGRLWI